MVCGFFILLVFAYMSRPSWIDYFLGLAKVVSKRSHDIHTQHGCVITDKNNRIIGVGYNGFPKNLDDSQLPLSRPEKYSWMVHSERNALANCVVRPDGGTAYITGQCCNDCVIALYQEGIDTIYMIDDHGTKLFNKNEKKIFDTFVEMSKIKIFYVKPNLDWLGHLSGVI